MYKNNKLNLASFLMKRNDEEIYSTIEDFEKQLRREIRQEVIRDINNNIHDKFKEGLRLLIEANLETRRTLKKENLNLRDTNSIALASNRRAGHTSSIISIAKEIFIDPVFIGFTQYHCSNMKQQFGIEAITKNNLHKLQGRICDCLIVDPASLFSSPDIRDIEDIGKNLMKSNSNFTLFLIS